MKEARQKSQTVRLVKDKLFINGEFYVSDTPTVGEDQYDIPEIGSLKMLSWNIN
jgi:hypothetical protein